MDMGIRTILISALITWAGLCSAKADVIHRVSFTQAPMVVTWTEGGKPISGQQVPVLGQTRMDPIPTVFAGRLEPVAASTGYAQTKTRFAVASNAPFSLIADGASLQPGTRLLIRVISAGENAARIPVQEQVFSREDLLANPILFQLDRRTAVRSGSIESQSIRFEVETSSGFGLPEIEVQAHSPQG